MDASTLIWIWIYSINELFLDFGCSRNIYMVILDMGNSINSHVPVKNKQYGKFWLCLPPRVSYPMGRMLASCMLSGLLPPPKAGDVANKINFLIHKQYRTALASGAVLVEREHHPPHARDPRHLCHCAARRHRLCCLQPLEEASGEETESSQFITVPKIQESWSASSDNR